MIIKFKIFEGADELNIKKYLVWNAGASTPKFLYLLKVVNIDDIEIKAEIIGKFSCQGKKEGQFVYAAKGFRYISTTEIDHIIYQSDNLQDCENIIPVLASNDINKYNL